MDSNKADPDTQGDVDSMVLDYLLCTTIETTISNRIAKREGHQSQWDVDWLINSINTIKSVLPDTYLLTGDINLKLQILRFTSQFLLRYTHDMLDERMAVRPQSSNDEHCKVNRGTSIGDKLCQVHSLISDMMPPEVHKNELDSNYLLMLQNLKIPPANACSRRRLLPLINITVEFIKLCAMASSKVPQPCWFNTISQLLMQSIIEELRIFGELSTQNLKARLAPELVSPRELEWAQNCDTYINYLQPPPGVHTKHHLEDISDRFPLFQLEGVIIDAIVNLMKKLDPPVLVQLERGKLRGMTVLETRRLKRRLGLP